MNKVYNREPAGKKSRRLYFQAAKNYAAYISSGYYGRLFAAIEFYNKAVKIGAINGRQYVAAACAAYSITPDAFIIAMIDGGRE